MRRFWLLTLILTLSSAVTAGAAENWPRFRGADALSVADNPNLPLTWSETENVAWKTAIPGAGWGSPIIWGDKVFLSTVVSSGEVEEVKGGLYFGGERGIPEEKHSWRVYAIDLKTGAVAWEREVANEVPKSSHHLKNTFASESPATDGERVYFRFGQRGTYAFDMDGNEVWRVETGPSPSMNGWGTASSPTVYEDKLILVSDSMADSYLIVLDSKTGNELWRAERDEPTTWATPFVWENELRKEIIVSGQNKLLSYDLAGNVLWEIQGPMGQLIIPSPFEAHGLLFVTSGYINARHRPVFAIKPGASGDITPGEGETSGEFMAWYNPTAGPYNPSPIVYGDYYYTLLDRGFFTCHDAKTGKEVYGRVRINPGSSAFTVSPWAYRDRIFCMSEDGDVFAIQAGPEFKVLERSSLDEFSMSSPAIAGDRLVIRTLHNLYCIQEGATTIEVSSAP